LLRAVHNLASILKRASRQVHFVAIDRTRICQFNGGFNPSGGSSINARKLSDFARQVVVTAHHPDRFPDWISRIRLRHGDPIEIIMCAQVPG
jgi:hypothetical protein